MSGRPFRCRTLWSLSIAAALTSAISLGADSPPPAAQSELQGNVARLVAQLDAEKRSERAAALQSLLSLGPAILPLLPDDRTAVSPAARDAVAEIRARLERESALATLAASHVTLRGRFPLREILDRVTAQTGNRFDAKAIGAALLGRPFQVDYESQSFWKATDDLCEKAGLSYAPVRKALRLILLPAAEPSGRQELAVAESGPFRMAILSAGLRPSLSDSPKLLRIHWSLNAEPRLRPLFASIAALQLSAGIKSTVFKPLTPTAKWELSMDEGAESLRFDSDFEIPATSRSQSVAFRGTFTVEMAAGPERFIFDDLASGRREVHKFGSVTVALQSAEFTPAGGKPGSAKVEISLIYDQGGPAFESYRTWMYHNEAYLETKNGRRLVPQPIISTRRQGDGSVAVEYNFADVQGTPRDFRFVYIAPTLITQSPVEFQFQNIPVARAAREGKER
jgi:hypothetical protein